MASSVGSPGNQSLASYIKAEGGKLNEELTSVLNSRRLLSNLDMGPMSNILTDRALTHLEQSLDCLKIGDAEVAMEHLLLTKRAVRALKTECR